MTELEKQQKEILQNIEDNIMELKVMKQIMLKGMKELECASTEAELLRKQNDSLMLSLKNCTNELCMKCGKYKNDHLGACDGCKWKDVKHWDVN